MPRSKSIMLLFALLALGAALVLWYTIDRGTKNRAAPPQVMVHSVAPATPAGSAPVPANPVAPAPIKSTAAPGPGPTPAVTVPPQPAPALPAAPDQPVDLGGQNERKTIDFTSGKPVVKDSPEDKAAIDDALKDMAAAAKDVTFEATKKKTEPPPAPPKS